MSSEVEILRHKTKVKFFQRQYGELTYEECVILANEAEQVLSDLDPFDPARMYFSTQVRHMWEFAYRIAELNRMYDVVSHIDKKKYLLAWVENKHDRVYRKGRTEEIDILVPKYLLTETERKRYIAERSSEHFECRLTADDIELLEIFP